MKSIGSYEAKTHLPRLLDRVAQGESIVITKRGSAVAMLVPVVSARQNVSKIVRNMLSYRDQHGPKLGKGRTIKQMIDEGRRF